MYCIEVSKRILKLKRAKSSEAVKNLRLCLIQLQASRERQNMNCAYCTECWIVVDLVFSQINQPVFEISRNKGIRRSSIGHIIHDLFRATRTQEENVPICVANVFSGSEAT